MGEGLGMSSIMTVSEQCLAHGKMCIPKDSMALNLCHAEAIYAVLVDSDTSQTFMQLTTAV